MDMCGIFGVLRAGKPGYNKSHDASVVAAFSMLGGRSVARGKDSAGFASVPLVAPETVYLPVAQDHTMADVTLDGTRIVRGLGRFEQVFKVAEHAQPVGHGVVVLGHTRAATQGSRTVLNASPLLAGSLVGTHNGDITTDTIPGAAEIKPIPQTDSALLYEALDKAAGDLDEIVKVLTAIRGRAALAWVDRTDPTRVFLARAALSPLVTAYDAAGNLWWASVPSWFTSKAAKPFGFRDISFVPEGTVMVLNRTAKGKPRVVETRTFTPTARNTDERLGEFVWRDFTDQDKAFDQTLLCHKVVTVPAKKPTYKSYVSAASHLSFRESVEMAQPTKAMKSAGGVTVDRDTMLAALTCPAETGSYDSATWNYSSVNRAYTVPRSYTTRGYDSDWYESQNYESQDDLYGVDEYDVDDLFDEQEKALIVHEEAQEAYINWVENGCATAVADLLGIMKTAADAASIAEEFAFTFDDSSWMLKELISVHAENAEFQDEFATA